MPTTWNPADLSNVTLSGGNLVASASATGGVRSVYSTSTGKWYFEYTVNAWGSSGSTGFGIGNASAAFATVGGNVINASLIYKTAAIWINGVNSGSSGAAMADGALIGFAIDVGGKLLWARQGAAGNWNNNATNNPATGVGGLSITPITSTATFGLLAFGTGGAPQVTANFGATAFSGAVPAGYTAGFGPAAAAARKPITFVVS